MASQVIDATKCTAYEKDGVTSIGDFLCKFNGVDPDKGLGTINDAATRFVIMAISVAGIVALAVFLWGCFLYVTSFGDDTKAETAKKTILWSVVGLGIIGLADLIVILTKKVF